ncbi:MAG: glycosyltransferase family 2 protein [Heliomarina sp.]|uniref:glycosyltransferase family 2 protein n=1 Tax=Heliomarina sp. TaxID=2917556 RepID=UPI004059CF4D
MIRCLIASSALTVIFVWFPLFGIAACSFLLLAQVALIAVRISAWRQVQRPAATHGQGADPIFSVHVATYNEPPDMVIQTLRALAAQNWPRDQFEVVVIDNNTSNPALWKPIETFCAKLGDGFTFLHRENVSGAKAGALNIALEHSRADATHIVTVDADYCVFPEFLCLAREALASSGADYIQFPQAYRMSTKNAVGVDAELEEYFRTNITTADCAEAMLLTGTLSVLSKQALIASGGWSGSTTTEDAELGLRLCRNRYTGRFIATVVGQGLLPLSLNDLESQRYRWASGNLATLMLHARDLCLPGGPLRGHQRIAICSQLTAWVNLSFLPATVLLIGLLTHSVPQPLLMLSAAVILLSLLEICSRIMRRGAVANRSRQVILSAISCRLALAPVSAVATMDAVLAKRTPFNVTNKSTELLAPLCDEPVAQVVLALAATFVLSTAWSAGPLVFCAVLALILPLPAALLTRRQLRDYRSVVTCDMNGATA